MRYEDRAERGTDLDPTHSRPVARLLNQSRYENRNERRRWHLLAFAEMGDDGVEDRKDHPE